MTKSFKIQSLLQKQVLILDGATGTELQKKGLPSGVCPEIWCLENPALLADVHASYVSAGAQVVYTCTFGANRFKLGQFGVKKDVYAVNRELALLARKACGKKALVAGDIGPTGLFIEPFGPLAFEEAVAAFKEQARGLIDGGCDMIVIETMIDIQEARAALVAVKELADIFTLVSMTYEPDGHTLGGTPPAAALVTLQSLGANAVGCNCSAGPEQMVDFIAAMRPYTTVPLLAKPNAGMPRLEGDRTVFDMDAPTFAAFAKKLAAAGAALLKTGPAPPRVGGGAQFGAPVSGARYPRTAFCDRRKNQSHRKKGPAAGACRGQTRPDPPDGAGAGGAGRVASGRERRTAGH